MIRTIVFKNFFAWLFLSSLQSLKYVRYCNKNLALVAMKPLERTRAHEYHFQLPFFWSSENPRKQAERASNQNLFVNSTENLLEFGRVYVTFCPSLLLSSLYITRMYEIFQQESSPAGHRIAFRSESTPPTLAHRLALPFWRKKKQIHEGQHRTRNQNLGVNSMKLHCKQESREVWHYCF